MLAAACALALAVLLLGAANASAAPKPSSTIVYVCGPNLCAVDPATGAAVPLTTDGAGYGTPSISRDGRRIAASRGAHSSSAPAALIAGAYGSNLPEAWGSVQGLNDVAISPDGSALAYSRWYTELEYRLQYVWYCNCLQQEPEIRSFLDAGYQTVAAGPPAEVRGRSGVGFLDANTLLSSVRDLGERNQEVGGFPDAKEKICLVGLPPTPEAPCTDRIAEPWESEGRRRALSDPAASPDGKWIAAVLGLDPGPQGSIVDNPTGESPVVVLYDGPTGARVREVAANATKPTFSPDGTEIAYESLADGAIYVVPTAGGTPRRLVEGTQPTWGMSGGGASVMTRKARLRRGRVALKVACQSTTPCDGRVTLRRGKRSVGVRPFSVQPGKTATIRVKPSARVRKVLERKRNRRAQRLTATVSPAAGAELTSPVTVRGARR